MAQPQIALALATVLADIELDARGRVRFWLALAKGASERDLPPVQTLLQPGLDGFATGWATPDQLAALAASAAVDDLDLAQPYRLERPVPRRSAGQGQAGLAPAHRPAGAIASTGGDAVLGLIDTGLPFAHRGLRRLGDSPPGTRLLALWDQDPTPDFGGLGQVPRRFDQGAVLDRATMDRLIKAARGDEAEVYRRAGYGAVAARRTHGAHVLGLLAMGTPPVDAALGLESPALPSVQACDLLGVQLPRALLDSPSRGALCSAVLDGLLWMREVCADRPLRVVVPYGTTLGPHDGSSLFERALDQLLAQAQGRLAVFLPAGNSHEMHLHAVLRGKDRRGPPTLAWRLPPGSEAASQVELWAAAGLIEQVTVTSPDGRLQLPLVIDQQPGGPGRSSGDGQSAACIAQTLVRDRSGRWQTGVAIRFAPTLSSTSGRCAAASGDWTITVQRKDAGRGAVHAYGARARGSYGAAVRGQQGRFVVHGASAWKIDPRGSISGMATGRDAGLHVVGGYVNSPTRASLASPVSAGRGPDDRPAAIQPMPARYSSSGPARNRRTVDESFACEQSGALQGVRSAGTLSAITWRMNGSSVAAPQAARLHAAVGAATLPAGSAPAAKDSDRLGRITAPGLEPAVPPAVHPSVPPAAQQAQSDPPAAATVGKGSTTRARPRA